MEQKEMTALLDKKAYGKLLSAKLPHVITSQGEYKEMSALARELMLKGPKKNPSEIELLKLVGILIDVWQKSQPQVPKVSPREVLEFLMEANGHCATDLYEKGITDKRTLSKILSGRLSISNTVAFRLGQLYSVNPALFVSF
jgi:antitoxin component HigA of HigAB toxin-antitoxin module